MIRNFFSTILKGKDINKSRKYRFLSIFNIPQSQLPRPSEIPDSFYIGQNYVEDKIRVKCTIELNFYFLAEVEPLDFDFNQSKVSLRQTGPTLQINIQREISDQLWKHVLKSQDEGFILPYILKILPGVNQHLLNQRYIKGHILTRTFSIMDAQSIFISRGTARVRLRWPISISGFPPSVALAEANDEIYLRDYVDALHSYFKNDYDDCIRRVITSVENLIKVQKLKDDQGTKEFADILRSNLDANIFSSKVILDNLLIVYKLRNKIVHDRVRVKTSNGQICRKALGTLNYFLQRFCRDKNMYSYVMSLSGQFLALQNLLGETMDLDDLELIDHNAPIDPERIINSPEDMDKWMFGSLQITDAEKDGTLRG